MIANRDDVTALTAAMRDIAAPVVTHACCWLPIGARAIILWRKLVEETERVYLNL